MIYLILFILIVSITCLVFHLSRESQVSVMMKKSEWNITGRDSQTDYDKYNLSLKEKVTYFILSGAFFFTISYVFYRSIFISALILPAALLYLPYKKKEIIKRRKEELNMQFKEALYAVSSSLTAGRSIEIAFKEAYKDMLILFIDTETFIIKELEFINRKIEMNETIESALEDLAARSHLEDIRNFVDVFKTCKRAGGNLVQVIKNTSDIISDKISTKQEISAMLAQRKFEQKILNILPIGMIFLISSTSPEFMEPIYSQIGGRITMTISLALLVLAFFLSKKVMDIEV